SFQRDPALVHVAIGTLVIGVTSFFRDAAVFKHLAEHVLPALPRANPRIWSAGCSDGGELYSVAMLMAELGLLEGAVLLGSDCRPPAVACAREGRYDLAAVRDVPSCCAERYLEPHSSTQARISRRLRAAAQ